MAIVFEHKDGWFRPRFICDACQQPISDIRDAMAIYAEPKDSSPAILQVLHAHKHDACQISARQMVGHSNLGGSWDELANHIVMLATDTGFFPNDFAEQYQRLLNRGRVPPPPGNEQ
jgi:hypothetical protein